MKKGVHFQEKLAALGVSLTIVSCSMRNFGFWVRAMSDDFISSTLKITTAVFSKTLVNIKYLAWLSPKS